MIRVTTASRVHFGLFRQLQRLVGPRDWIRGTRVQVVGGNHLFQLMRIAMFLQPGVIDQLAIPDTVQITIAVAALRLVLTELRSMA